MAAAPRPATVTGAAEFPAGPASETLAPLMPAIAGAGLPAMKPSFIVSYLDQYVIGQEDAKRILAVAVYAHFRKIARAEADHTRVLKSNVLLIGSSGTGKTLMCETLSHVLDVPFVTAEATSLAHTRYVNEEIEAVLQRLVDRADGDLPKAQRGIVFIDEIDKLKAPEGEQRGSSGESVQHALLKIMEGSQVKLHTGRYIDTTNILFVCGGAFVGLDEIIRSQTHGYGFIATSKGDNQRILDRLNTRVKPTDLFTYGLIPEFTGRLPIIARFHDLTREMLVRIMTDTKNSLYGQFRDIFRDEGVELVVEPRVFEQIAELAIEYKTGARSLRGIFEELMTPVLYQIPDSPDIRRVVVSSLFTDPAYHRAPTPAGAPVAS
jgi:ATP-dependent Clp protease ATP-binding subunit ClpX